MPTTLDMPETLAVDVAADDQAVTTNELPDCSGCTDPRSEGTHQEGTKQHPDKVASDEDVTAAEPSTDAIDIEQPSADKLRELLSPEETFLTERQELEKVLSRCVLHVMACKAELKHAQAEEKEVAELLQKLLYRGPEKLPLFDSPIRKPGDPIGNGPAAKPVVDPNAWRTVPISKLDLKPKLIEKLQENGIDTIGQLEDLRAQGNAKGVGLRSVKGIGDAKVTEIEDQVLAWLSANRDAGVFAAVNGQAITTAYMSAAEWEALPFEEVEPHLQLRVEVLYGTDPVDREKFSGGCAAYLAGHILSDCPFIPGPEQDDWLRGWNKESLDEDSEDGNDESNDAAE